jgi:hypothetical protein
MTLLETEIDLQISWYDCKKMYITLKENFRLQAFEYKVPRKNI